MTRNNKELLLAHEFGHAIYCRLFDKESDPISIDLTEGKRYLAFCSIGEKTSKQLATRYSRLCDVSSLGGLFGELLFQGSFDISNSREDIDNFLVANRGSKSSLYGELYNWFWLEDDEQSYCKLMRNVDTWVSEEDMKLRLPWLHDMYTRFNGHIDVDKFIMETERIVARGTTSVKPRTLNMMIQNSTLM
jgi:hypothetical protein